MSEQIPPPKSDKKKKDKNPATKPVYIRIPFSKMFDKESPSSAKFDQKITSLYKLIDRVPSCGDGNDLRKRKSYIMSYNTETNNANWVYEILNESTLEERCKENISFGKNKLENKECNQGHLAAAANHRWCQEAYHDTFLMSNMTPQNKSLNEGMWSMLEQYCRDFVEDDSVRNVHVYTGPFYQNNHSEEAATNKVKAVPFQFFKVVIVEKKNGTVEEPECYVMPNKKLEDGGQLEAGTSKKDLLKDFKVSTNTFDNDYPFKFIERDDKFDVTLKKTVELKGEYGHGQLHSFNIDVILTPPRT